ncbi:MAG TPA: hypothetical protein VII42_09905, partial [Caulobacteraceae bacterium]
MGLAAREGVRTNALRSLAPRADRRRPGRRAARSYRLFSLASAVAAFVVIGAGAALADDSSGFQQINGAPILATTTLTGISTAPLSINTVALGDVISIDTLGYSASDSQTSTGQVDADTVLNTTIASGDVSISSQAGGNLEEVTAPQGGVVQISQTTAAPEGAPAPTISASVEIGVNDPAGADTFGGSTTISARAFGDLFSMQAVSGLISTTPTGLVQSNASPVDASIDLAGPTLTGLLSAS